MLGLQAIIFTAEGKNTNANIPNAEHLKIVDAVNAARRKPSASNMQQVTFDPTLELELVNFTQYINPEWFFETGPGPGPAGRGNTSFNGFNLMRQPQFAAQFPGYGFLIHDTCSNHLNNVLRIFKFRIAQAHCLKYAQCSNNTFSNFESCGAPLVEVPKKPCSWATQYLPRLLMCTLSKLACVKFNVKGPSAPPGQNWSFWCYGKYKKPRDDQPFAFGEKCSMCPSHASKCNKGLCSP